MSLFVSQSFGFQNGNFVYIVDIEVRRNKKLISEQAATILQHRYYLKDLEGVPTEDADGLFKRVASAIASVETQYDTLPRDIARLEDEFFDIMSNLEFLPNSPTLMNAGTEQGTLSVCFVLPLEDSMEGIMNTATKAAMVQKFGGGTGFSLSKIRPKGAKIITTHGKACGPIEVLKTLSRVSSMITQGGKRDGANMAVMSIYHPDILEFIECKKTEGDIHNFNISVGVDSDFMEAVKLGADYFLKDPSTNEFVGAVNARDVFNKIIEGAWTNGEPGMVFLDSINKDNKVGSKYGDIIATNPCGEQPLLGNESCNLGSINLAKFYSPKDNFVNLERLRTVVRLGVRFLDNVIDANEYPIPEIRDMTKATRKIGLGIMGFADLLVHMGIPYNTAQGREVGSILMKFIYDEANVASLELGALRGTFPAWAESDYPIHENYRNACRLTVAPTGTISMIADTSNGIEPMFALAWKKQNILEGQSLYYVNSYFENIAKERGFYSDDLMEHLSMGGSIQSRTDVPEDIKSVFVTAQEISSDAHVLMQAVFQKYCDSGISKTINFSNTATKQDVEKAYMLAWETGCKGITVYRNGSREKEVLVTMDIPEEVALCECPNPIIVKEAGCESCKSCGWSMCHIA